MFCDDETVDDSTSSQADIEQRSQEISRMFSRMHGIIQEMKSHVSRQPASKLLKNVLQWMYKEISQLSQFYRACQREYITKLQEKEKYKEQFVINFDEEIDNRVRSSRSDAQIFDIADEELDVSYDKRTAEQQQQLLQQELVDMDALRERDAEMNSIMKSVVELNEIFQEINTMVVNQGSLLDRIDYNIETVQLKVEQGALQIAKAERNARSARKLKCIAALAGSILLTLLILIIQS